jgi:D-alanine-D-alanine ligase
MDSNFFVFWLVLCYYLRKINCKNMKTVALFFGGPSNEHEVSIVSAKNILENFPIKKYKMKLVYWDKSGLFYLVKSFESLGNKRKRINIEDFKKEFDIALPITHGKYGEDGVLQGIFEFQKIKYCGSRSLSSALCMDKSLFKSLLLSCKINQVKFLSIDYNLDSKEEIFEKLSIVKNNFIFPLYVKPSNSGSSVGITKIKRIDQLKSAIKNSLIHDNKVLIEEGLVNPKEVEVAVLGNDSLFVSVPGELKLTKDFYDYDDKYKLNKTEFIVPANITNNQIREIDLLSKKIYELCGCSGFARIDFFISGKNIYINEINTLPGFTSISMYPMLMARSGIKYSKLIEKIIKLAY